MVGARFGRWLAYLCGALLLLAMLGNAMCLSADGHKGKQEEKEWNSTN